MPKRRNVDRGGGEHRRTRGKKTTEVDEETVRDLLAKSGKPAVANDFLGQKVRAMDRQMRRGMIERNHSALSVAAQNHLPSIP